MVTQGTTKTSVLNSSLVFRAALVQQNLSLQLKLINFGSYILVCYFLYQWKVHLQIKIILKQRLNKPAELLCYNSQAAGPMTMMPAINHQLYILSFRSDSKHPPCLTAAEATIRQGITKIVIKFLKQDLLSDTPSKKLLPPRNCQLESKMLFIGHSHTVQPVAIPR